MSLSTNPPKEQPMNNNNNQEQEETTLVAPPQTQVEEMNTGDILDFFSSGKEYVADIFEEVLDDSMDIDWNTRVGAERIAEYLFELTIIPMQEADNEQSSTKTIKLG
jgi:hypothetical protein